ncbi:MAG: PilZ domain-containing protein, partial [Negativicutes bacterium]|nr:PilZ domain-containing protein [Negativicutes bacterium]
MCIRDRLTPGRQRWPGDETKAVYLTQVVGVDEQGLRLSMPLHSGRPAEHWDGGVFSLRVVADGVPYILNCRLLRVVNRGEGLPYWQLAGPLAWYPTQSRQYCRVNSAQEVWLRLPGGQEEEFPVTLRDLSAGGLAFYFRRGILVGSKVGVRFDQLADGRGLVCSGLVTRVRRRPARGGPMYIVAVTFVDVDREQRKLLVRAVWVRQAALRREREQFSRRPVRTDEGGTKE